MVVCPLALALQCGSLWLAKRSMGWEKHALTTASAFFGGIAFAYLLY